MLPNLVELCLREEVLILFDKIREKMEKSDTELSKVEEKVQKSPIAFKALSLIVIVGVIILYCLRLINFDYMLLLLCIIGVLIAIFSLRDRTKDAVVGVFGTVMVVFIFFVTIFKPQALFEKRDLLLCILTSILILHDSMKEKRIHKKPTNLQIFRLLLVVPLLIMAFISLFWDFIGPTDLWSICSYLIYFVPLILIKDE
jgi:membrane-bound ClpP family serine protease